MLNEVELLRVACEVWSNYLGVTAVPRGSPQLPAGATLNSLVRFQGDQNGGLLLTMGREHARDLAASVFVMNRSEVGDQDLRDLIGDLANIFAGNLQAHSSGACGLALPEVYEGAVEDTLFMQEGKSPISAGFESSDGASVLVRVF